jgi:hypothetical protein
VVFDEPVSWQFSDAGRYAAVIAMLIADGRTSCRIETFPGAYRSSTL